VDAGGVLPSGVVTFVLTDVVGSTQLWESAPEAMRGALAVHDKTLAGAVEGHGGVVLKARGEGDSTFSVFGRASDAVRAAYDAQVALSQQAWPPEASLRVRVAIHTGEATEQDGDYVGTVVNRAARLRSVTEGGEIVVSSAVAHVVVDHLPLDTALHSLGQIRLRDLDRGEEAFVLTGPGLAPASARPRGELPVDVLRVKGVSRRERDVFDAIADRLTNAEIAARFSVSERTIETHVSALLRKLGAKNRIELAALAKQVAASATVDLPPLLLMSAQRSVCVGRHQQRSRLLDCWDRAARGLAAMAVVTGEAGVGKSRLVAELAVEVHQRGGQVLLGTSTDGAQLPYQPFVEALSDTITSAPEGQLRADIGRYGEALARVLPGVPARLGTMPAPAGIDPVGEREAAQAALGAMLAAMARRQPLLLVLEDLHWATPLTRETALHLARRAGTAPLLMVATVRDTPPEFDAALAGWLADVGRLAVCDLVLLTGLTLDATAELLQALGSALDASAAFDATGGNPLFLREIATAGPTSLTLQDFLADRFARLPDGDLDVLDTAVVLGESFRVDVVADAAGRPVDEVLESLERAGAAGIIEPIVGRLGAYTFVHALVRDVRYRGLSAGRLLRLHASVTAALAPLASDPAVLPDLARHACIAAPLGDAAAAVDLAEAAGLLCATAGDHTQAAEHYQRALDVIDLAHGTDERRRLELTIRLGEALVGTDAHRAHAILRDAARLARRQGDAAAFADAVSSMAHEFGSLLPGRDDPTFIALAEEALALLSHGDTRWRARVLALLGVHLALGSRPASGRALVREAVDVARRSDDPLDFVRAVLSLYFAIGNFELDEKLTTLHGGRAPPTRGRNRSTSAPTSTPPQQNPARRCPPTVSGSTSDGSVTSG
jgi:class 3 adenylate cyclase/DNA-binding CsgD family transcriptional regulator